MMNNPKKPIFIAFMKDEIIIGTTKPAIDKVSNWFLDSTPSVSPDGRFSQFLMKDKRPLLLSKEYFRQFSTADCQGIPNTGLYLYIDPECPIIRNFEIHLNRKIEELQDKVLRLEEENKHLQAENSDLIERRGAAMLDHTKLATDIKRGGIKDTDISRAPSDRFKRLGRDDEVVL